MTDKRFTHDDVRLLRDLAECASNEATISEGHAVSERASLSGREEHVRLWNMDANANRARARGLASLADRIAALLPPEGA